MFDFAKFASKAQWCWPPANFSNNVGRLQRIYCDVLMAFMSKNIDVTIKQEYSAKARGKNKNHATDAC